MHRDFPPSYVGARHHPAWATCDVCHGEKGENCSAFAKTHDGWDHNKGDPRACGQGCPCCRHRAGHSVCTDCTPHYKGQCTLGPGDTPCDMCLSRGSTKRHICRKCGAINSHFTRNCHVLPCNLGPDGKPCTSCAKKGGMRPHKCRVCDALNEHRTADCPIGSLRR